MPTIEEVEKTCSACGQEWVVNEYQDDCPSCCNSGKWGTLS